MKNFACVVLGIVIGGLAFQGFLSFVRPAEAQRNARIQFEYAAITQAYSFSPTRDRSSRIFGMAEVCYVQANGCRRAEVRHELDLGAFLQDSAETESAASRQQASQRAAEIAFRKAMTQLGNEGWEIISEPQLEIGLVSIDEYNEIADKSLLFERSNVRAVYFKRVRVQ